MSFKTEFDVDRPPVKDSNQDPADRLARAMSARWCVVTERSKIGRPTAFELSVQCSQEPCYEELLVQKYFGVPSDQRRAAAIEGRKIVNGGFLPLSPEMVEKCVRGACTFVADERKRRFHGDPVAVDFRAQIGAAPA